MIVADLAFDLEYDGAALETHEMDVRDLAPALLSTSLLFQELSRQVFPTEPALTVNVRATSEGSFLVQLKLIYDSVVDTLGSDDVGASLNLVELLGIVGGMIAYVRHRHRSPVVAQEPADTPGMVRVTFADGTTFEVHESVLRLADNVTVQQNLAEVVKPLGLEGVDVVRIKRDEVAIASVEKADLPAFERRLGPPDRDILYSGTRNTYLTIHTAGLHTNRWRFFDGQALIWATIKDEEFIAELDAGVRRVGKLDVLHCTIGEEQWRDPSGFHRQVDVLRVLDVLMYEPGAQGTLDLDGDDPPAAIGPSDS